MTGLNQIYGCVYKLIYNDIFKVSAAPVGMARKPYHDALCISCGIALYVCTFYCKQQDSKKTKDDHHHINHNKKPTG